MLDTVFWQQALGSWGMQTVAMLLTAALLPGLKISNPLGALLMVVSIAVSNTLLWDAALFFAIPDTISSQTATLVLCNGILFLVLVKVLPWIETDRILPCLIAPLVFSMTNVAADRYGKDIPWGKVAQDGIEAIQRIKTELKNPDNINARDEVVDDAAR